MSEVKIAEDLLGRYIELTRWDKGPLDGMQMPWQCDLRTEAKLIERVSAAESALAEAKAENARLRAPVSKKEWRKAAFFVEDTLVAIRDDVNALIAARSQQPTTPAEQERPNGTKE